METELRCPVCHEIFRDPTRLVCAHTICMSHFGNLPPRERISCPVCGEHSLVPDGGLAVDRILQLVVQQFEQAQIGAGAAQGGAFAPEAMCGCCEEQPASKRCLQCAGVLCADCVLSSHSRGFFKTHQIVDLDDSAGLPGGGGMENSIILCDVHVEEKLNFYCLDCRKPVCSHCLILGDHKGHQQTPIDQAFSTGRETLEAWLEKLSQRIGATEDLAEKLRGAEVEMDRGAEAQRSVINSEMDHFRDLIETKRQQLLKKSALEEKQKRSQLQAQVDRAQDSRKEARDLVLRSQSLLAITNEQAFLAVVLPLIQDMKRCAGQPLDVGPSVSCSFRPLPTDAQVRSLGELDLGQPRLPQQAQQTQAPKYMAALTQTPVGPQVANGAAAMHMAVDGSAAAQMAQPQLRYSVTGNLHVPAPGQMPQQPYAVSGVQYVSRAQ